MYEYIKVYNFEVRLIFLYFNINDLFMSVNLLLFMCILELD